MRTHHKNTLSVVALMVAYALYSPSVSYAQGIGGSKEETQSKTTKSRKIYRMPFMLLSDIDLNEAKTPIASITVSKRSYHFLLDTASEGCLLKTGVENEAALKREVHPLFNKRELDQRSRLFIIDGKVYLTRADLIIGTFRIPGVPFTLLKDENTGYAMPAENRSVAGVLGANVLSIFAIGFDYDRREMNWTQGGNMTPEEIKWLGFDKNTQVMPLKKMEGDTSFFRIEVACNGSILPLVVDTGAARTFLIVPADQLGVTTDKSETKEFVGLFGELSAKMASVSLSVGNLAPQKVEVGLLPVGQTKIPVDKGILGQDFLMRYNILLDFPGGKMYLRPRTDYERDK